LVYFEAKEQFGEYLRQFELGQNAIYNPERNIVEVAQSVVEAASRGTAQGDALVARDGLRWHRCVDLFDNICVCHRPAGAGQEFSVVERWGLKQVERCEVLVRGCDPLELLRGFIVSQREVLRLWIGDAAAQITEKLAEKYPGQDLTRVTDALVNRLTQSQSHCHTVKSGEDTKHTREIHI